MAVKVTFDTANKLIIAKAGITELSTRVDIYSDAKEDRRTDSALNKYRFIMWAIGGDETSAGEYAPMYLYLMDGWKIRPDEADHVLNITDGAVLVDGDTGANPFVPTVGAFTVLIREYVPVRATQIQVGSGVTEQDKDDITAKVWEYER